MAPFFPKTPSFRACRGISRRSRCPQGTSNGPVGAADALRAEILRAFASLPPRTDGLFGSYEELVDPDASRMHPYVTMPVTSVQTALYQVRMIRRGAGMALVPGKSETFGGAEGVGRGRSLLADDAQATYDELSAKGVTSGMKPERMPWGVMGAEFSDSDGNTFYLNES